MVPAPPLFPASEKALFNRACAHGLLGEAAPAAADIERLLGLDRARWLPLVLRDKDLASVRDSPEVAAAIAEWRSTVRGARAAMRARPL